MPWTAEEIDDFVFDCVEKMEALQEAASTEHGLDDLKSWSVDMNAAVITFTRADGCRVLADFYAVGLLASESWQWAWSHASLPKTITQRSEGLKALAKESGLAIFDMRKWEAGEEEGWQMLAIALAKLGGIAGYRLPAGESDLYVVITRATISA